MNKYARYCYTLVLAGTVFDSVTALAHEEGAPFSGSIVDPLMLHHAHIENEQRFNFFALNGMTDDNGTGTSFRQLTNFSKTT